MLTMKELAAYFDIPYYVVYRAMRGMKAYCKHNQKFNKEVARKRIIEDLERQSARAMEKHANCEGMIRKVRYSGGQDGTML